MISLRGFCITTLALAVWEFDNVGAALKWLSPVSFYFKQDDNIFVNIILQNVPTEATRYDLYHQTNNCGGSTAAQHSAGCDVPGRSDTIPTNRTITIMQKLDRESLRIYIVLRKENKFCATKWIMDGVRDNGPYESPFGKACLNIEPDLCGIIADFRNQCEDSVPEPNIRIVTRMPKYNVGETKSIFCQGQHLFEPLQWYSPSGKLVEGRSTKSSRVYVERNTETNDDLIALIIHKIKINHGGNWTCKAGNLSETKELIVVGEQTCPKIVCSHRRRLTCEVVDEDLPEETVHQWYQAYRDGSLIGTIPPATGNKTDFKIKFHKFDNNTYISSVMNAAYWVTNLPTEELKITSPTDGYYNFDYDVEHLMEYTAKEQVSFSCSNDTHTQVAWIDPTGNRITTYNKTTVSWRLTKEDNSSMLCCLNYRTDTVGIKTIVERTVTNITVLINYEELVNEDSVKGQSVTDGLLIGLAVVLGVAAIVGCVFILNMKKCCRVKSTSEEPPQTYVPRNRFYVNLLFRKECQAEIYAAEHVYEEIN